MIIWQITNVVCLCCYLTDVSLQLCVNHTIWTFRQEVTCEKMLISCSERDTCLAILRDMAYSSNELMYNHNLERLEAVGCGQVLEYIRSTWHDIRSQWVEGLKEQHLTFGETTVQRLESVGVKMKGVCCEIASLQQFFMEFRTFLSSMRAERTHRAMMMLTRKPTAAVPDDLLPYRDCLTPYAFRIVHQQYTDSLSLGTCSEVDENIDTYVFASATGTDTTRLGCCSCRIYTSRRLPCKHLLYVRRIRGVEFDESVFDSRWKRADYANHCQLNLPNGGSGDVELLDTKSDQEESTGDSGKRKAQPSSVEQAEKYRKARHMTNQLASLCAKPGMAVFASRMKLLRRLYDCWSKGTEATLVKLEDSVTEETPSHSQSQLRKRGRPPKLPGKTATKRMNSVGRPKGSTNVVTLRKSKRKYHQSAVVTDDDDDGETSGAVHDSDAEAFDEDGEQMSSTDDVGAVLLAMAADNDACLSADDIDSEVPEYDLDLSTAAEADGSQELSAADDNIADITDCIAEDDTSYVIVPENSGLLQDIVVGNSRLELQPIDVMTDIRMPLPPRRKRGRPPKGGEKTVPEKRYQKFKADVKQEVVPSLCVTDDVLKALVLQSQSPHV